MDAIAEGIARTCPVTTAMSATHYYQSCARRGMWWNFYVRLARAHGR